MNLKVSVSFCNNDKDYEVYQYLQTKRDKSNYIKELIENDMLKQTLIQTKNNSTPGGNLTNS